MFGYPGDVRWGLIQHEKKAQEICDEFFFLKIIGWTFDEGKENGTDSISVQSTNWKISTTYQNSIIIPTIHVPTNNNNSLRI